MTVRNLAAALIGGLLVAGVSLWPGELPVFWAIALSIPAAAITLLGARVSGPLEPTWTAVPDGPTSITEMRASTLATRLAEASRDQARFVSRVQPRLRGLALARLRERHPDLSTMDDPRATASLGDELHALLCSPKAVLPTPRRLAVLLDRLEEL